MADSRTRLEAWGTRNRYWFRYQQRVLRLGRLRWICRVLRLNRERVRRSVVATPLNTPAAVSVQPAGKVPEVTDQVTVPVPPYSSSALITGPSSRTHPRLVVIFSGSSTPLNSGYILHVRTCISAPVEYVRVECF